jgi:hypothetical protein
MAVKIGPFDLDLTEDQLALLRRSPFFAELAEARARLGALLAEGMPDGGDSLGDETLELIREQVRRFTERGAAPFTSYPTEKGFSGQHKEVREISGPEPYLEEDEFAERYHVSERTAQRWRQTGDGPPWARPSADCVSAVGL